jgi:hypothetical protein
MTSPIITPIPIQTETEYRPVSRLAVIGLLLSLPSIALFVNLTWALFIFTMPAVLISAIALRAIRRSDGALAGEAVALMGIVISVACGLGWVTAEMVTKLVTQYEARQAVDDWIEKMRTGQSGAAFLLTQAPRMRRISFNPEEHRKLRKQFPIAQEASHYDNFLADPILGQFLRNGEQVKAEYVGLVAQRTVNTSVVYNFKYRLTTPETEGDWIVAVRSEDEMTDQGMRREWIMGYDRNTSVLPLTKHGESVQYAVTQATPYVERLVTNVANEKRDALEQLLTKDKTKRGEFEQVYGYLRNKVEGRPVFMALQKPLRLRGAKKDGSSWHLTFDCTTLIERERLVEFTITAVSDPADAQKWTLENCRFYSTRRVITPDDDPAAPKATMRRPSPTELLDKMPKGPGSSFPFPRGMPPVEQPAQPPK